MKAWWWRVEVVGVSREGNSVCQWRKERFLWTKEVDGGGRNGLSRADKLGSTEKGKMAG